MCFGTVGSIVAKMLFFICLIGIEHDHVLLAEEALLGYFEGFSTCKGSLSSRLRNGVLSTRKATARVFYTRLVLAPVVRE